MSNLKHLSLQELKNEKDECLRYIDRLSSKLSGQRERLKWIENYIYQKTPVEMTWEEMERAMGHRVIIKETKK